MVIETLDRSRLVLVQTPQAFRAEALRAAHADGGDATDDAALVEAAGGKVVVVAGDVAAAKVTTPEDLASRWSGSSLTPGVPRVGLGFDVHPFSDDSTRPSCSAASPSRGRAGSAGPSDADAVATRRPTRCSVPPASTTSASTSPTPTPSGAVRTASCCSATSPARAHRWFRDRQRRLHVVLETPRLAPVRDEMQKNLGGAIDAPVSVKATRPESLGALGRGEGIACLAVALVVPT